MPLRGEHSSLVCPLNIVNGSEASEKQMPPAGPEAVKNE